MTLIKCPECGKEISDKATCCIHCGCPMDYIIKKTILTNTTKNEIEEREQLYTGDEVIKKEEIPTGFQIKDDVLIKYNGTAPKVVVPNIIREIGEKAFFDNKNIRKVRLPKGLLRIDNNAFSNCSNLKQLYLPDSITFIGHEIISGCRIYAINIPKSIIEDQNGFAKCRTLRHISIPKGISSLKTLNYFRYKYELVYDGTAKELMEFLEKQNEVYFAGDIECQDKILHVKITSQYRRLKEGEKHKKEIKQPFNQCNSISLSEEQKKDINENLKLIKVSTRDIDKIVREIEKDNQLSLSVKSDILNQNKKHKKEKWEIFLPKINIKFTRILTSKTKNELLGLVKRLSVNGIKVSFKNNNKDSWNMDLNNQFKKLKEETDDFLF